VFTTTATRQTSQPPRQSVENLEQMVTKKEQELKATITKKFDELISKLNERRNQVLAEVHGIYEKLYQGL
jgi:hypothetical protein